MSKVNMNSTSFEDIVTEINKASSVLDNIDTEIWTTGFNVYSNIEENLNSLYEDGTSNFESFNIKCTVSATSNSSLGCTKAYSEPQKTACDQMRIIDYKSTSPQWVRESNSALLTLIQQCAQGSTDCYTNLVALKNKMNNVQVSLQEIKTKINDYQHTWANLDDAAAANGLAGKLAVTDDGIITNINTTVTIDDEEVQTTVADVMNSFYTYVNTVSAAEIEADYLHDTYGIDVDYDAIVEKANTFLSDTITSGLYTKGFINSILPEHDVSEDEALDALTGATGLGLDGLETLLDQDDVLGEFGKYAGLIGTSFLPKDTEYPEELKSKDSDDDGSDENPKNESANISDDSSYNGSSYNGSSYSGSNGSSGSTGSDTTTETTTTPTTTAPEESNDIEIEKVDETEIPEEEEKFDYGTGDPVDYDKLAREQYEFGEGADEINEHLQDLYEEVENAYESGNLDSIKQKLKDYGFSEPEINAIIADKNQCIKAMWYCDRREILAAKAQELAKADGVENYDTSFDDKVDYDSAVSGENANDLLINASEDESCVKAYETMNTAKEAYQKALTDNNAAITKANDNKKTMEELKTKYEKEFSSEDTTKWSETAAKEYNEAIKTYNESVKDAATAVTNIEAAKTSYTEARTAFENAEKSYYDQVKQQSYDQSASDGINAESSSSSVDDGSSNAGNDTSESKAITASTNTEEVTELNTNNVLVSEDGEINFNFGNTGVQGATLTTDSANQDILDGITVSDNGISV